MASSSWVTTPSLPDDRKRVIGELTRGREVTNQLRHMLRETAADGGASALPAQGLVGKILDSFTQSISMLCAGESDEVSQIPAAAANSPARKSEDSGESYKTPAPKDRRGCYKRRRSSETYIKDTPTLFEDGHAWRKYGQKVILNAKYPRNYFRCTHKFDQSCQATKQVQKIRDDPPLHRTTYHGRHTCKNLLLKAHHIILDAAPATGDSNSSIIWSFQAREPIGDDTTGVMIGSSAAAIKREIKEECRIKSLSPLPPSDDHHEDRDCFIPRFDDDHNLGTGTGFSPGSDHGDVISSEAYSCSASTHSTMDVDMMVGSVDLDDFLEFDRLS